MYVFLNIFADVAKIILGLLTTIIGFGVLLAVSYAYAKLLLTGSGLDQTGWVVIFGQFIVAIILMVAGAFVARR